MSTKTASKLPQNIRVRVTGQQATWVASGAGMTEPSDIAEFQIRVGGVGFGGAAFGESSFGGVVDPPSEPVEYEFEEMEPGSFDDEPSMGTFIETDHVIVHRTMRTEPPGWAEELIDNALPIGESEAVLGDLYEEYQRRALKDRPRASRWYWCQAARIVFVWYFRFIFPLREKA